MNSPGGSIAAPRLCRPGETCWRLAHAHRVAPLIDADAYFRAVRAAMIAAERSIDILAWELHSKVELVRPDRDGSTAADDGWPVALGDLLIALARAKPRLQVRILLWDFAMIYAHERELIPIFRLPWKRHPRVRLHMDASHPIGASQHQKIVAVDGRVAFCGGLDLTANRWDTREHLADDPRRTNPAGEAYGPFHDSMMVVDGAAARALAEIARERWHLATGEWPAAPELDGDGRDPWPADLVAPLLRDIDVAIARTFPAYRDRPAVREVERLFLESIDAARHAIYVEQQYFTSEAVARALEASLARPAGPDIVIVLPYRTSGWLEETAMGVGRARLQRRLQAADRHGRLRVYHARVPGAPPEAVKLHAKIMVVDNRLLRIGSANLSNRSLGFDSECDLALEAREADPRVAEAIRGVRDDLLAEHLGSDRGTVAAAIARFGGLIAGIESLRRREDADARTLAPLHHDYPAVMDRLVPDTRYLDPERPIRPERFVAHLLPVEERAPVDAAVEDDRMQGNDEPDAGFVAKIRGSRGFALLRLALGLLAVAAVVIAWVTTPLAQLADPQAVVEWARTWRSATLAPVLAVAGFMIGSLLLVPVTVMITVSGLIFGPLVGFATALAGSLAAAAALYGLGAVLGRDAVRWLSAPFINRISDRLARRGAFAVALLRMVPVAPFTLINLAAGAVNVRLRDYMLGSALGMAPGMIALTIFGDRVQALLANPTPLSVTTLLGAVVLALAVAYGADRLAARRRRRRRDAARRDAAAGPAILSPDSDAREDISR